MAVKTFEQSMTELEDIVSKLEAGDITLDASLELFEKGIKLANFCQKKLDEAEKNVKVLTYSDDGEIIEKDFGDGE